MSVISDASPLIFLSKIEELSLIKDLFKGPYYIPSIVYHEVLDSTLSEEEKIYLKDELKLWKVKPVKIQPPLKGAGSLADWSVFELAHSIHPTVVLADDKFLRNILATRGLLTLGTLGLLNLAASKKIRSKEKIIELADLLVEKFNLWIDAPTYSKFLKSLK
ncbi:MAG: hypothetical protein HYT97_08710 [Elusimicrobia bacterium]|nr:hypothetical protein [Elusimicrobiota bacterium]